MEIRWKNNKTKELGVALITDDDANVLEFLGYKHCYDEDFTDDEYDGEWVEIWKPIHIIESENNWFGMVRWCDEDLIEALENLDIPATKYNVDALRYKCENDHHFTDGMVEAGWETINYYIDEIENDLEV